MQKRGFSLAELLVTMTIIFIVIGLTIGILTTNRLKKNQMLQQKAYYNIERVVSELVNNTEMYPYSEDINVNPHLGNISESGYQGHSFKNETKFCGLFSAKMFPESNISCTAENSVLVDGDTEHYTFKTADGITWGIPITTFATMKAPGIIYFDINGDKGSNCITQNDDTCKTPDRFMVYVYQDGKISKKQIEGIGELEDTKIGQDDDEGDVVTGDLTNDPSKIKLDLPKVINYNNAIFNGDNGHPAYKSFHLNNQHEVGEYLEKTFLKNGEMRSKIMLAINAQLNNNDINANYFLQEYSNLYEKTFNTAVLDSICYFPANASSASKIGNELRHQIYNQYFGTHAKNTTIIEQRECANCYYVKDNKVPGKTHGGFEVYPKVYLDAFEATFNDLLQNEILKK